MKAIKNALLFLTPFMCFSLVGCKSAKATESKVSEEILNMKDAEIVRDDATTADTAGGVTIYQNTFAARYFANLRSNFGYNSKGSCGYVATGMLLSFWDTYWDDSIIPEQYDEESILTEERITKTTESPGVTREPYSMYTAGNEQYHNYIHQYRDSYFHFLLMDMGNELYGTSAGSYGMNYSNYIDLYNHYCYDYLGRDEEDVSIIESRTNVRQKTIDYIKQGIPVKLSIGGHAVVAYDYDEANDDIYCHFGWSANTTHVTIESQGYSSYAHIEGFDFSIAQPRLTSNYHCINSSINTYVQPYSLMRPSDFTIRNWYLGTMPTCSVESLMKEKWLGQQNFRIFVQLRSENERTLYGTFYYSTTEFSFGENFVRTLEEINEERITIRVGLYGASSFPILGGYEQKTMLKPTREMLVSTINPADWGFKEQYFFASDIPNNANAQTRTVSKNGLTVSADRLRCGFIEKKYVVMSPRRKGAGKAYLTMNFNTPVNKVEYQICMWSTSEKLDGSSFIQVKDINGNWTTLKNLPISSLGTTMTSFTEEFVNPIYGFRFEVNATATGSSNKGRFCVGQMSLSH